MSLSVPQTGGGGRKLNFVCKVEYKEFLYGLISCILLKAMVMNFPSQDDL